MKQSDFKPCANCDKGVTHSGSPIFYRLTLEQMCIDLRAVNRQRGLEMMLGNQVLAHVMGVNEDMAKPMGERIAVLLCQDCALKPSILPILMESQDKRADCERTGKGE